MLEHGDKVYEQVFLHLQLRNVSEQLQETEHSELKMRVDLDCNFCVGTAVPDTSHFYATWGYFFFPGIDTD